MSQRLGQILKAERGSETRLSFAKRLDLSYTFVRSLEEGLRRPSDEVLIKIAERLSLDADELLLAVYCDRSPHLEGALRRKGMQFIQAQEDEVPGPLPGVETSGFVATDKQPQVGSSVPELPVDGVAPPDLPPGRSEF